MQGKQDTLSMRTKGGITNINQCKTPCANQLHGIFRLPRKSESVRNIATVPMAIAECIYGLKDKEYYNNTFYNNKRIQLRTKLTPLEKRCQFVA